MPERPLLILPLPGEPSERQKKSPGRGHVHYPSRERQAERLAPRFEDLQRTLEARRARLQMEAPGLIPEEVIVLETVGTVEGFIRAVEKIPGMEWLGEIEEEEIPPDDDFFALDERLRSRPDKPLRGRLFMIFTNQTARRQMLSLWGTWQASRDLPRGLGRWGILFKQLRDVRPWGVRDRLLETGVLEDWQERVSHGQEIVPCEIEIWYRQNPEQRQAARERVAGLVVSQGGEVLHEAVIEEIAYHALLVRIPIGAIRPLLDDADTDAELVQCEQIQFFRASGQMAAVRPDDERQPEESPLDVAPPAGRPVVALLDGLPLQGHHRLEGRLSVDDPDDFEAEYPANERRHGTSMASLILYGDLAANEIPLTRPLYVRPILRPDSRDWRRLHETVPENILITDLLHRAVRRLFEGEGAEPPVAPEVAVINFSIGIADRLFDGSLSPLARLLDWLSWHYKVLFIVSAGNHAHRIELACTRGEFDALTPAALQEGILKALAADARQRRLLSPAEGMNALTVGALHEDILEAEPPPLWRHPYTHQGLPSPINAQGMGYRRAIKPEILAPGGRVVIQDYPSTTEKVSLNIYDRTLPPGQLVAAPGRTPGDRNSVWHTRGTSNATALVSRAAALLHDALDEIRELSGPDSDIIESIPRAVWLKALLAHGADWGTAGTLLDGILRTPENSRQFKEYLTRLLGYGGIDVEKVRECTAYRATALSCGYLSKDLSHIHRFPLPPSLSGQRGKRRLTVTLAWLTPVNPRHQSWRRADFWFAPPIDPLRVERKQADWRAVRRGTLQHEILEGEEAAVYMDGASLEVQVSCRADAGALEESVPYALVITLEVAEEIGIQIYDEVRVRVQTPVQVVASP
jgi:hypothetical protein